MPMREVGQYEGPLLINADVTRLGYRKITQGAVCMKNVLKKKISYKTCIKNCVKFS
jgi:hypothetical protein